MNLFRSEEHIRTWARFDPATEEGILTLLDLVKLFSASISVDASTLIGFHIVESMSGKWLTRLLSLERQALSGSDEDIA